MWKLLLGRDAHALTNKGHPSRVASLEQTSCWRWDKWHSVQNNHGFSPGPANESFLSGNISPVQLLSDPSVDMHGWNLQRHKEFGHGFQHPSRTGSSPSIRLRVQILFAQVPWVHPRIFPMLKLKEKVSVSSQCRGCSVKLRTWPSFCSQRLKHQ